MCTLASVQQCSHAVLCAHLVAVVHLPLHISQLCLHQQGAKLMSVVAELFAVVTTTVNHKQMSTC